MSSKPTPDHLAALAQGRAEGAIIRNYLTAIQSVETAKRKGRAPRSADDIAAAISASTDPVERLKLRPLLREAVERERATTEVDVPAMEKKFLEVVVSYSTRNGLTYADWRAEGVPPAVLKAAGLTGKAT